MTSLEKRLNLANSAAWKVAFRRWGLPKIPNHKRERFGAITFQSTCRSFWEMGKSNGVWHVWGRQTHGTRVVSQLPRLFALPGEQGVRGLWPVGSWWKAASLSQKSPHGTKRYYHIYHMYPICHIYIYTPNFFALFDEMSEILESLQWVLLAQRLGFFGGKKQIHGDPGKSGSRLGAFHGTGLQGVNIHHPLGFSLGPAWRRCWYVNIYILFQESRMNEWLSG